MVVVKDATMVVQMVLKLVVMKVEKLVYMKVDEKDDWRVERLVVLMGAK